MEKIDYDYLCTNISNLSGIPVRLYKKEKKIKTFFPYNFEYDPILPYESEILKQEENISTFIAKNNLFYCSINTSSIHIVMGPTRHCHLSKKEISDVADSINVPLEKFEDFSNFLNCIIPMPVETVLQILYSVNYLITGKKMMLKEKIDWSNEGFINQTNPELDLINNSNGNNSLLIENQIIDYVLYGDMDGFKKWLSSAPGVNCGVMSQDTIRQLKNIFIVTTTLVSRAAIKAGVEISLALNKSDQYIQTVESYMTIQQIQSFQVQMITDFITEVQKVNTKKGTMIVRKTKQYVHDHLQGYLSVNEIASALNVSRVTLSFHFKEETGENLSDYILRKKINESKRYLKNPNNTLASISDYLGFSSQSHFTKVFKKYTGLSPKEYQKKL